MGHIITDLKETFRRGNTFIRLIYINVGIFVIGTLISYNMSHCFYFFFLQYIIRINPNIIPPKWAKCATLSPGLYVLGGICGGLFYMIAYNIFPYFSQTLPFSTLVGASASVLAIVAATAYREPNYRVQLFLFGAVRSDND